MGGGFSALDPTSNNFLGGVLPAPVTRAVGDVTTGGLAEFGRPDSFGLPPSIATPLKIGAGTIGGGMLGGPAGSFLGGTLGGLAGGNPLGGAIGGGIGGLLQSLIAGGGTGGGVGTGIDPGRLALGGSLMGLGLAQDTSIPNIQLPSNAADQQAITGEEQSLRNLYGQQNQQYGDLATQQRQNLMTQLGPNGTLGKQMMGEFNNYGITPTSGAFQEGLGNQLGDLARQQQSDILGMNVGQTGELANLDASRLSRQFGLEDLGTQANLATTLGNAQQKADLQKTLLGLSGDIFGGGGSLFGGGGGGGGTAGAGGGGGGLFGGAGSFLSSLGSGVGNLIQGLMGGGTPQGQPGTGDPNLDLYGGGNPFSTAGIFGGAPTSGPLAGLIGPVPGGAVQPRMMMGGLPSNLSLM